MSIFQPVMQCSRMYRPPCVKRYAKGKKLLFSTILFLFLKDYTGHHCQTPTDYSFFFWAQSSHGPAISTWKINFHPKVKK